MWRNLFYQKFPSKIISSQFMFPWRRGSCVCEICGKCFNKNANLENIPNEYHNAQFQENKSFDETSMWLMWKIIPNYPEMMYFILTEITEVSQMDSKHECKTCEKRLTTTLGELKAHEKTSQERPKFRSVNFVLWYATLFPISSELTNA